MITCREKPEYIQVLLALLLAAVSQRMGEQAWDQAGQWAAVFPLHHGMEEGVRNRTKHVKGPPWAEASKYLTRDLGSVSLFPQSKCVYNPYSRILPDAGAMWGSCGVEAELELPSRAGALRGEEQVMEIEMQILLQSGEKAPINQE